jgi:hypothetical protein
MASAQPPLATFTSSLALIANSHSLRCDAKLADTEFLNVQARIRKQGSFELSEFLPSPIIKGTQPEYLDFPTDDSVPVVNTLSIQNLSLNENDCRHITREDFDDLDEPRKLVDGDVLLTVDGGVSIGKPLYFEQPGDFTIDSHVCILRPEGVSRLGVVYLLASPIGQMQFRHAESGASGQTAVTEEDIRRFIFPLSVLEHLDDIITAIEKDRQSILRTRAELAELERKLWERLTKAISG